MSKETPQKSKSTPSIGVPKNNPGIGKVIEKGQSSLPRYATPPPPPAPKKDVK